MRGSGVKAPKLTCECGCGKETPVAQRSNRTYGHVLGEQVRFILGHNLKSVAGPDHPTWKGGRTTTSAGYVMVRCPDHVLANKSGYVYEHRLVASETLGRPLRDDEQVHHLNGDKGDNRPENLEVMVGSAHSRLHGASLITESELRTLLLLGYIGPELIERGLWQQRVARVRREMAAEGLRPHLKRARDLRHRRTHCKHGHDWNAENVYVGPTGDHSCRACARKRRRVS